MRWIVKFLNLKFLLYFLILFSSLPIVFSTLISPGKVVIDFVPNKVYTFGFFTGGAPNLVVDGSGSHGIDVKISELVPRDDGNFYFTVTITMPETYPIPGDRQNVGGITVKQTSSETQDTITTLVSVSAPIFLNVPYPGRYVISHFEAPNINVNETLDLIVKLINKGFSDVQKAFVKIDIYSYKDFDFENKIVSLTSGIRGIKSREETVFHLYQNTSGWNPGEYKAVATIFYDINQTTSDAFFNIGSLNVIISNYTKEVPSGKINKFDINIESKWNNRIDNIYGEVTINGTTFKTPSVELIPWTQATLSGYWDTINVPPGDYDALIRVFYSGKTKTEKGIVKVLEVKQKKNFINTTNILIAAIVLLVGIDIIFILLKRRARRDLKK